MSGVVLTLAMAVTFAVELTSALVLTSMPTLDSRLGPELMLMPTYRLVSLPLAVCGATTKYLLLA
ncbi:hypothetical protein F442_21116 [Phytophthora nicotianae P10297]|nr:hypothetical protein F442_21116 [Phytophthora nicotianae P10297]